MSKGRWGMDHQEGDDVRGEVWHWMKYHARETNYGMEKHFHEK